MATGMAFPDENNFPLQIKTLSSDELLEVWLQTQELERVLYENWGSEVKLAYEYEKYIILELQYRHCKDFYNSI